MDSPVKNGLVVDSEGTKEWWLNGLRHREGGPAIEKENGYKEWYRNGKTHREDGPAIEYADGSKEWYKNGSCHREDGPAFEKFDGTKAWYQNGKLHREDGPAIVFPNRYIEWHFEGRNFGGGKNGFWKLWNLLTEEQKGNPNLLKWIP